jgi:hypothetical protein
MKTPVVLPLAVPVLGLVAERLRCVTTSTPLMMSDRSKLVEAFQPPVNQGEKHEVHGSMTDISSSLMRVCLCVQHCIVLPAVHVMVHA